MSYEPSHPDLSRLWLTAHDQALAMSFGEEACRIRKEKTPLAVAIIRHVALNLRQAAKQNTSPSDA